MVPLGIWDPKNPIRVRERVGRVFLQAPWISRILSAPRPLFRSATLCPAASPGHRAVRPEEMTYRERSKLNAVLAKSTYPTGRRCHAFR
jgi:hypothetical protein